MQIGHSSNRNLDKTPNLEISIWKQDEFVTIKLSGAIDEDNDLADQIDKIPNTLVVINLRDIERINSCGVRDWVNWIGALEVKGSQIILDECSTAIVGQLNLVSNFTGCGLVKSFYIPYFCTVCEAEKSVRCEAIELLSPATLPPSVRCNECENFLEFDDMPDAYFAFLSDTEKVANPDKLPHVLAIKTSNASSIVAIEKTVSFQSELSFNSAIHIETELEKIAPKKILKQKAPNRGSNLLILLPFVLAAGIATLYALVF